MRNCPPYSHHQHLHPLHSGGLFIYFILILSAMGLTTSSVWSASSRVGTTTAAVGTHTGWGWCGGDMVIWRWYDVVIWWWYGDVMVIWWCDGDMVMWWWYGDDVMWCCYCFAVVVILLVVIGDVYIALFRYAFFDLLERMLIYHLLMLLINMYISEFSFLFFFLITF